MIRPNPDNSYTATEASDFEGWEVLAILDWKPGVKQVHMRKLWADSGVYQIVFCDEAIALKVEEEQS